MLLKETPTMGKNLSQTVTVENAVNLHVTMLLESAKVEIIAATPHWVLRDNHRDVFSDNWEDQ